MGPIFSRVRLLARGMAVISIALAIGAISASAAPILITFDADPVGNIPGNDFTSVDSSQVHFMDTEIATPFGYEMFIQNASFTNDSNALGVAFDDDNSALRILLDVPATSIGMDFFFGNEFFLPLPGDEAVLTAFLDDVVVGEVSKSLFLITPPDQSIFLDGVRFDAVEFEFVVSSPGGMTEFVDNVNINPIPEPRAAIAFGAGALLVGAAIRRRSRAEAGLRAKRR
ncbi:MAG: hypothetical protein JRS35_04185 [Deltaproteobacteria bacterium]|nr:hypothetical protein [Deltaproteobacteria bacterium]